jgi:hypothetical protein
MTASKKCKPTNEGLNQMCFGFYFLCQGLVATVLLSGELFMISEPLDEPLPYDKLRESSL